MTSLIILVIVMLFTEDVPLHGAERSNQTMNLHMVDSFLYHVDITITVQPALKPAKIRTRLLKSVSEADFDNPSFVCEFKLYGLTY